MGILLLSLLTSTPLRAQAAATLSGVIAGPSGVAVPNANVSLKNIKTGQTIEVKTGSAGVYHLPNVAPGNYTISVAAEGFASKTAEVTLTGARQQTMNLTLTAGQAQQGNPAKPPPGSNLPNAPSSAPAAPSMQDLGFSPSQTQGNAQEQALLNKRTHMLKVHQTLGLITAIPMAATVFSGGGAKTQRNKATGGTTVIGPSSANLDLHMALGGLTTGLYFATAYYATFAPKVPGTKTRGAIRLHRDLEWIHGPGMILTPILGVMAYNQENKGQRVHGVASAHSAVAYVTAAAYGASIVSVSWPIHWKFWR